MKKLAFVLAFVFSSGCVAPFSTLRSTENVWCGNALEEIAIENAMTKSHRYQMIGMREKAIRVLLPHAIRIQFQLADNENLARRAARLMRNRYGSERARVMLDDALREMTKLEEVSSLGLYQEYRLTLIDTDVRVAGVFPEAEDSIVRHLSGPFRSAEDVREAVRKTVFYREIAGDAQR